MTAQRTVRRLVWILAVLVVALLAIEGLGRIVLSGSFFSKQLMKSEKVRAAHIQSAGASLLGGSLDASHAEITLADSTRLYARSIALRGSWLSALFGRPDVEYAVLMDATMERGRYVAHLDEARLGGDGGEILQWTFGPRVPIDSLLAPGRATSYEARWDTLRLEGWDRSALRGGKIHIERATFSGPAVRVYSDRRLAGPPRPATLPQEQLRALPFDVRVDEVRLRGGTIVYEEVPRDGQRPGMVEFGRLRADLGPLDNRRPDTLRVGSRTMINGALPLAVELIWPLQGAGLDLRAHAWTSAFSVDALNPMFEPNAGIRIRSGQVDTLETRFEVVDGRAAGTLDAVYRDLEVESLNKNDPSDRHVIKSWVLDWKIHENRSREDQKEPGRIEHRRSETESIFTFLWFTVRSGLFSLVSS